MTLIDEGPSTFNRLRLAWDMGSRRVLNKGPTSPVRKQGSDFQFMKTRIKPSPQLSGFKRKRRLDTWGVLAVNHFEWQIHSPGWGGWFDGCVGNIEEKG